MIGTAVLTHGVVALDAKARPFYIVIGDQGTMRRLALALFLCCPAGCGPSSGARMLEAGTDGRGGLLDGSAVEDIGFDAPGDDVGPIPLAEAIRQWCNLTCASTATLPCNKSTASVMDCADICAGRLMQPAKAAPCEAQEIAFFTCAHHDPDTAVYMCVGDQLVAKSALCATKMQALNACLAS